MPESLRAVRVIGREWDMTAERAEALPEPLAESAVTAGMEVGEARRLRAVPEDTPMHAPVPETRDPH